MLCLVHRQLRDAHLRCRWDRQRHGVSDPDKEVPKSSGQPGRLEGTAPQNKEKEMTIVIFSFAKENSPHKFSACTGWLYLRDGRARLTDGIRHRHLHGRRQLLVMWTRSIPTVVVHSRVLQLRHLVMWWAVT